MAHVTSFRLDRRQTTPTMIGVVCRNATPIIVSYVTCHKVVFSGRVRYLYLMANTNPTPTNIYGAWGYMAQSVATAATQLEWVIGVLNEENPPHFRIAAAIDRLTRTHEDLASLEARSIEISDALSDAKRLERLSDEAEARAHSRIP